MTAPEPQPDPPPVCHDEATGTYWPHPGYDAERHGIEWVLRYGEPTRSDLLHAAFIVEAYDSLVLGGNPREKLARARRAMKAVGS